MQTTLLNYTCKQIMTNIKQMTQLRYYWLLPSNQRQIPSLKSKTTPLLVPKCEDGWF